ncbi:extracellular solute-binding protein [Isoptericola hypogeus]|uniref:Extracellular solute-binding protein n=1 Tax=Isoptericola hypogeus TaxID=300179 RepID=A0ABN2JK45_9MICO
MSAAISASALSRRNFLGLAGAGALAVTLASCGTRSEGTGQVSNAEDALLPKHVPLQGLTPDLPGTADGVPPGFFSYPEPFRSVSDVPLTGETISAISMFFATVPNGRADNPAWQEVEKRLGGTLDINAVSDADYESRFSTTVAGGDLPDMMLYATTMQDHAGFLDKACEDLTPHLGGDAIEAYPNLAAIPELFWEQCVMAGKLYYLPIPRAVTGGSGFFNAKRLEEVGVTDTAEIADADTFFDLLGELTDPSRNRWALGSTSFGLTPFRHVFRVPYEWRVDGGKLVKDFETDEYLAMIEYVAGVREAGYFVPGSEAWEKNQMVNKFVGGQTAIIYDGLPGYATYAPSASDTFAPAPFVPFGHDGGAAQTHQDNVLFSPVMLKKGEPEQIERVLRVANFLAAPFGSEEYLLLNYGVEGVDYDMDAGNNPIPTDRGLSDVAVPWKYLAAPQQAVYFPGHEDQTRAVHGGYSALIPISVPNPVASIYSPTNTDKGGTLSQPVSDTAQEVIAGRKTMKDLEKAIATWASKGGDTIRGEYEQGLAA